MKALILVILITFLTMAAQACEYDRECYQGTVCSGYPGNPGYCKTIPAPIISGPQYETYRGRACFSDYDCGYINGRQARCIKEFSSGYCE